jgi:hypothetical protein
MPPMRHAPASLGRPRRRTPAAPVHVVLRGPDALLRGDVFLVAAQHRLMLRCSSRGSRLGQLAVQLRQPQG